MKINDVELSVYRPDDGSNIDVLVFNLPLKGNLTFLNLKKFLFD